MRNKKIIFLIPNLDGGGGRVVSELTLNLPDNLEKVIVSFENRINFPYKGELISLNIPLSKNLLAKLFIFLKGFLKIKKIIIKEKPDYVISFGNLQNIINILSTKNSMVRVDNPIPESHRGFFEKIYPFLVKILFNKAEKIIVVSKGLKKELIENFKIKEEKIKLIYNSIDIEKIKELSKESLETKYQKIFEYPVIINIGSLIRQKGQWHLIRAFREVKKRIKDLNPVRDYRIGEETHRERVSNGVKLVILGEGELESYLKGLVKNLNLEKDVYFLGWQKNPFKFLAKSKLFVLSSLWEGFGIVISEAMACGLPVISSDCNFGPREILAPDTNLDYQLKNIEYGQYGILVPVCDGKFYRANESLTENEKILSQAITETLTDKELLGNLKEKSKQRAEDFDIKKIIKNWHFLEFCDK